MGRTRTTNTRTRHLKATSSQATSSVATPPSVPDLLAKAQSLIEQCNYQLAARFLQRILETDATHIEARELLGVVQLELGDLDAARLVGPPPTKKITDHQLKIKGGISHFLDVPNAGTTIIIRAWPWSSLSPLASRTNL